jgi:hypothetical protein
VLCGPARLSGLRGPRGQSRNTYAVCPERPTRYLYDGSAFTLHSAQCTGTAASRGRPIPAGSHKLATHTPGARCFLLPHPPWSDSDHSHARSTTHMHSPVLCQCIRPPLPPAHDPHVDSDHSHARSTTHMHSPVPCQCIRPPHAASSTPHQSQHPTSSGQGFAHCINSLVAGRLRCCTPRKGQTCH